jgi:hypothetical protein
MTKFLSRFRLLKINIKWYKWYKLKNEKSMVSRKSSYVKFFYSKSQRLPSLVPPQYSNTAGILKCQFYLCNSKISNLNGILDGIRAFRMTPKQKRSKSLEFVSETLDLHELSSLLDLMLKRLEKTNKALLSFKNSLVAKEKNDFFMRASLLSVLTDLQAIESFLVKE